MHIINEDINYKDNANSGDLSEFCEHVGHLFISRL